MSFTELVIKRPTLVVVLFAVLGVLGIFSYTQLKYELLPKISPPVVVITTVYPGASPNEVETGVTKRVEDAVSSLDKIDRVSSTSSEGISVITIEFLQNAKLDIALQDAQRKVNEITSTLPTDAKTPVLSKIALDEFPVIRAGVTSTSDPRDFYQLLKDRIQPRLARLSGVGNISLIGGDEREIKVNLDAGKLKTYGLSILQVTQAIKNSNLDFPTGRIKDSDGQYVVRVAGKFNSVEEMRTLIISRNRTGGEITLGDVAEVADGSREYTQINRLNGRTSIGLNVQKQSDANAVDVSKLVRAEVAKIEKDYAGIGLRFDIAQDGSLFTLDAAHAVQEDLMIAIVLVAIVMLVFLHSFRNSFIVMVSIPVSLISTFGLMYLFGFSLNLMTLLGLSLAVGIWVDDSIVVLENIYRRLEMGDDQRTAAIKGRDEIGFTALSITLVDVVVFLPLSFVGGIVGNIFREFALVIVGSTLISLLVSFTITPVLASRITKLEHMTKDTLMGRFSLWFEAQFNRFVEWYLGILKWALGNGWKVAALVVVLLIGSFSLFPLGFIGGEFITQSDRGEFSVALELPPGAKFEQTNAVTLQAERIILDMQGEVEKVSTTVGASADGFVGQSANNITDITVALVPKNKRTRSTAEIQQDIKLKLLRIPGLKARVNEIGIFGTANQTPIQLGVGGTDPDSVRKAANHLADIVRSIKGTTDVRLSSEDGKPETRVEIDRQKMAAVGLTVAEVGGALRVALAGDTDAKFRDGQNEYDIRIGLDEFDRSKTANVGGLTFVNNRGQLIELQQFASIITGSGPTKLQRADRNSNILVYSQVAGRPSGSIWADIQQAVAKNPLPGGTRISLYGDLKSQSEANSSLGLAFLAGILFVYMIMVALYDSYLWPLVVLFSIPLAVIGAFLALALAAKSMNIFTILGFLMLIGLVAKNAILLVDFTNKSRDEGFSTYDALIESGKERLRPILMTTLTMILGMLPIALSQSAGSEWKTGLAWALIGGLTSSMFLTLVVVPTVYITFDGLKSGIPAFFRGLVRRREPAPQGVPQPLAGARFSEVKP